MEGMFLHAPVFNRDISKWDVSRVTSMDGMFLAATSFTQRLCGAAWVHSKAKKDLMFEGSPGSISQRVCALTTTRRHVTRRPLTERGLKNVREPISTSTLANTSNNNKMTCAKCGTFEKSDRVSCCAPDGAWYKNCGGAGNRHAGHRWFEGVEACKRKSKSNPM